MKSWVLLCGKLCEPDLDAVRAALDDAFPGHFLPARDDASFVVDGPTPGQFLIRSSVPGAAGLFMIMTVPGVYADPRSMAACDETLRRSAGAQRAWMSIDCIGPVEPNNDPYRFIGPAIVRIAPSDAAVLVHPTMAIALPFNAETQRRLSGGLAPEQMGGR